MYTITEAEALKKCVNGEFRRYDTLCTIRYYNVWIHSKHDRLYGISVYECHLFPMKTYKNLEYLKKKIREYQKSL